MNPRRDDSLMTIAPRCAGKRGGRRHRAVLDCGMAEPRLPHPSLEDAEAICGRSGARLTRLRRQVLELLLAADAPVTAYELLDRLRLGRRATPAGIYRSLDFLLMHGLVHRLDSRKAFVACIRPDHPHVSQFLICRRCGTAVEVADTRISSVVGEWSERLGFEVEAESLEVSGSCATCRSTPAAPGPAVVR
jgi:Fur family zinc uptake transcriptional regulator